ncbi:hypothetical protein SprV_0200666900 [Sparganum proliferum]
MVKAFLGRWVAIFGARSTITIDRGAQFESNLLQSLLFFLGCTRTRTTAYYPDANRMVGRFHRRLKTSLRVADDPENRKDHLPLDLLGIRSVLKPDLDCFATGLVFGVRVPLPGEMISQIFVMRPTIPPKSCTASGSLCGHFLRSRPDPCLSVLSRDGVENVLSRLPSM